MKTEPVQEDRFEGLRLRPAFPFSVIPGPGRVRLVAGEDLRYTLNAPGIESWFPPLFARLEGTCTVSQALDELAGHASQNREDARTILQQLVEERVLVEVRESALPARTRFVPRFHGRGMLRDRLEAGVTVGASEVLTPAARLDVLCQDRLDLHEVLAFNRECSAGGSPWMWTTIGPMARGYVSPVCLAGGGPCLRCLLVHFRRLSPFPELHDELIAHAERGGSLEPVTFPAPALAALTAVATWKVECLDEELPPPAVHRLHVLEVDEMKITTHPVVLDPGCDDCGRRRWC